MYTKEKKLKKVIVNMFMYLCKKKKKNQKINRKQEKENSDRKCIEYHSYNIIYQHVIWIFSHGKLALFN